ncbi:MAG: hypothetical protein Fur0037_24740 [Planctomycetota bacterium]
MARFAVTGASGFVGRALSELLRREGHEVLRLVRRPARSRDEASWDPRGGIDPRAGESDHVVHLAGENIASGRWTRARARRIHDSRVIGTANLCRALASLRRGPRSLVSASAVGYYGDRGDEDLFEDSASGSGFLAEVARGWENATAAAAAAGIRVAVLRIGLVLGPGGALARMRLPFSLGLGGRIGSGRQYVSWIAIRDLARAILHAALELEGAVNATSPHPVTNAEFARSLGRALHRPALLPAPAFALRILFGRMADECLLASQRALPRRLLASGFRFEFEDLDRALATALARR